MLEVSRPEVLRVINKFEYAIREHTDDGVKQHLESSFYAQRHLIKDVNAMVKAVDDGLVSNTYLENNPDEFVSITTGEIYDPEIYNSMKNIKPKGDAQAEQYVDKVIEERDIPAVLDKKRKPG